MIFGVVHKTDAHKDFPEDRTALCPCGAGILVKAGHEVLIESRLGEGNGFSDEEYLVEGARIIHSFEEVVRRSQVVLRVAPPGDRLGELMQPGQVLCTLLQYGVDEQEVADRFAATGATALALEDLRNDRGKRPIFLGLSEIAGAMMPHIASWYQMALHGGRGLLLPGIAGQPAAQVVIIGAGALGLRAADAFMRCGVQVDLIDCDMERLRWAEQALGYHVSTRVNNPRGLQRVVRYADVLVCAVNLDQSDEKVIISEQMVKTMKPGSLIIDTSIDQGGGVETSRVTSPADPVFKVHGINHYCVPNISALVPRTSSRVLDSVVTPFLLELGRMGDFAAMDESPHFSKSVYVRRGKVVSELLRSAAGRGLL